MPMSHNKPAQPDPSAILPIAKKYYDKTRPLLVSSSKSYFEEVVNWEPSFDGKRIDYDTVAALSCDGKEHKSPKIFYCIFFYHCYAVKLQYKKILHIKNMIYVQ